MRSITDAYGLGTHTIYTQPDMIHMYCSIQSMNCVLQGRRQLLVEVRRLGSYRGYDKYLITRPEKMKKKKINNRIFIKKS